MRLVAGVTVQNINSVELLWRRPGKGTVTVTGSRTASVSSRLDSRKASVPWGAGGRPQPCTLNCGGQPEGGDAIFFIAVPTTMVSTLGPDRGPPEGFSPILSPLCVPPWHNPQPCISWTRPTYNSPGSPLKPGPCLVSRLPRFLFGEPL